MKIRILIFLIDLIFPLFIGYSLQKKSHHDIGYILDRIMILNIMLLTPLLTCLTFWQAPLEKDLAWLPVLGILMLVFPGVLGALLSRKYNEPELRGSYILTAMFSNRSIVGILSVFIFFGETGYAYSRLIMMLGLPVYYIVGFSLAKYYYEKSRLGNGQKMNLKSVFLNKNQIPLLGLVAGFIFNVSQFERPVIFTDIVPFMVHFSAWCFLVPIGYGTDFSKLKNYMREGIELSLVRFIFTPLLVVPLGLLTGIRGEILGSVIILAFTPASIGAVIAAKLHKLNVDLPMSAYLFTTTVYFVLIFPLLLLFLG